MCVCTSSSFSFVMRKTCAHPLDSLVWAAMTATPQKHTRTWLLKLFKEQLPCRVIFKIKFLASSSEKERESISGRMRKRMRELATQFCLLISVHSARNWRYFLRFMTLCNCGTFSPSFAFTSCRSLTVPSRKRKSNQMAFPHAPLVLSDTQLRHLPSLLIMLLRFASSSPSSASPSPAKGLTMMDIRLKPAWT